jgi:hypothetical protein
LLIFESQPDNPYSTVDVFKALPCEKAIWAGDYPPLGWVYNLFMENTERFFLRVDDDCHPVCPMGDMVSDAMNLLDAQPVKEKTISHVALEMNPRLAFDQATGSPIPREAGVAAIRTDQWGPLIVMRMAGALPVVDKRFVLPWNESCHWRQVELYHINLCLASDLLTAYMLKWWGVMGHFSPEGVDGVSRMHNLRRYLEYQKRGFYGLRPRHYQGISYTDDKLGGMGRG